jgi:pyruvate/2-oxoglutarate/acetoin dehydrogenase E1 component
MTTVLESLNTHLHQAMQADERVYMIGEDLLDPYGGAFKVTRGLSDKFPERVLTTPISEAGIVGVAGGMALRGLRPVVEIMFGDFLALAADQIINSLTKFRWMYNDTVEAPVVIRTPMGGRRGYGPTHSQTLEKHFIGVPGLRVVAPCALGDPGQLLADAITDNDQPLLFVENKLLYLKKVAGQEELEDFVVTTLATPGHSAPTYKLTLKGAPTPTLTLAAYGYMAELAREAALRLAYEKEVFVELIVPTQLSPVEITPVIESLRRTRQLLTIEEGTMTLGWGAEMIAKAKENLGATLLDARRVAAQDSPVPASVPLETAMLPQVETILQTAIKMV